MGAGLVARARAGPPAEVSVVRALDPRERGFYGRELRIRGVRILAHPDVAPEALVEAARLAERLLVGCPAVVDNLEGAGAELHVIGQHQAVTDLPMYRHLRGLPFDGPLTIDERARGYGGLRACCAEEALLRLPSARHTDHRDVCTHELAHVVFDHGLDGRIREQVRIRYAQALAEGRWREVYAGTVVDEFFAELTMWWVGSHGDRAGQAPAAGRQALRAYDPVSAELLDRIWGGVLAPERVRWSIARRTSKHRSDDGAEPAVVRFENETDAPVPLIWVDHQGRSVPYGVLGAWGVRTQPTYVGHVWVASPDPRTSWRWRAGRGHTRARVIGSDLARSADEVG